MAYGNKMKDNEMNLVYKYYGNFTAKENYMFRQLVFNSFIYQRMMKFNTQFCDCILIQLSYSYWKAYMILHFQGGKS